MEVSAMIRISRCAYFNQYKERMSNIEQTKTMNQWISYKKHLCALSQWGKNNSEIEKKAMKNTILIFTSALLILSCNDSPSESNRMGDQGETLPIEALAQFVALDHAYIPPLFFTSVKKYRYSKGQLWWIKARVEHLSICEYSNLSWSRMDFRP